MQVEAAVSLEQVTGPGETAGGGAEAGETALQREVYRTVRATNRLRRVTPGFLRRHPRALRLFRLSRRFEVSPAKLAHLAAVRLATVQSMERRGIVPLNTDAEAELERLGRVLTRLRPFDFGAPPTSRDVSRCAYDVYAAAVVGLIETRLRASRPHSDSVGA
jgi:hypothetical protein